MSKYNIGDIISGKVTGIEKYGIFLSLDDGFSGLIHISEVSESFVRNINDYAKMDEIIKAKVIDFDENSNHLKLSIKRLPYREKNKVKGRIIETSQGFSTLNLLLDEWIEGKAKEIEEKK